MSSLVISNHSPNSPKSFEDVNHCFKKMKIGLISNSKITRNPLVQQNENPLKFLKSIFPFIDEDRISEVLRLADNNLEHAKNLLLEIDLNCNEDGSNESRSLITRSSKRTLNDLRNGKFHTRLENPILIQNNNAEEDIKSEINKIKSNINGNSNNDEWFDNRHPEYKKYLVSKCVQTLIKSKFN